MLSVSPVGGNRRCRCLNRSSSEPESQCAGGCPRPIAAVGRLATGRTDPQLQPSHVARLPDARPGGWFLEHGRSHPMRHLRTWRRRSGGLRRSSAAIRRVAGSPDGSGAVGRLWSRPRGSRLPWRPSDGPGCPLRCSQQQRLPSSDASWPERTSTGIDAGMPLTTASTAIPNQESRRVGPGRPLISSCISRHRPLAGQRNDPRDAGTSGGLDHHEVCLDGDV